MANRLQPFNLTDFSGGLNLRASQVQVAENESPRMMNIVIDPVGGIYSRPGWERYNSGAWPDPVWNPMRAVYVTLVDGTDIVYVASDNKLYASVNSGAFARVGTFDCNAVPHMADFAPWSDTLYVACGKGEQVAKRVGFLAPTLLTPASGVNWNDDYSNPIGGVAPQAELCETHAGYLFVANTSEGGVEHANRIRWSHPNQPEDWAELDFIDIETGGSQITALLSYEDHLLIFKQDSVWALYGYERESWQLIEKSSTSGTPSPCAATRSETTAFWFSSSERGAVFAYNGERPVEVSLNIKPALSQILVTERIWVGWMGRKLWVTVPWNFDGAQGDSEGAFVFDPSVSNGAWTYHRSVAGGIGPLVGGSNADTVERPLAVLRNSPEPCVVALEAIQQAYDRVSEDVDDQVSFPTEYHTAWLSAGWPTRKKSWRRPDLLLKLTGSDYSLRVYSYRDYDSRTVARTMTVDSSGTVAGVVWGDSTVWGDPEVTWGETPFREGARITRGSSFGLAKALQLRLEGATPGQRWGVDAIILKFVARRFR